MKIGRTDPLTGKTNVLDLDVTQEQLDEFASPGGRCIQFIMPNLTADEREFLQTGLMSESWDEIFDRTAAKLLGTKNTPRGEE